MLGSINLELSGGSHHEVPPGSFFKGLGNLVLGARWTADEVSESVTLVAFAHSVNEVFQNLEASILRIGFGNRTIFEDTLGLTPFHTAISTLDSLTFPHDDSGLELNLTYRWDDGVLNTVFSVSFARVHLARTEPIHIRATAVPSGLRREPNETSYQYAARVARQRVPGISYQEDLLGAKLVRIANDLEAYHQVRIASRRVVRQPGHYSSPAAIQSRSGYDSPFYGYDTSNDLAYLWMMDDIRDQRRQHPTDSFAYAGDGSSTADSGSFFDSTGTDAGHAIGDFIGDSVSGDGGFGDSGGSDGGGSDGGGGGDGCGGGGGD
ncbi:MAG: hypothetical protein ACOYON_01665 [Fimbriimonas sp.]